MNLDLLEYNIAKSAKIIKNTIKSIKSLNMSGTHISRPKLNKYIDIILDNDYNKIVPKSINLRPKYDIEYIRNCYGFSYPDQFEKIVEVKKIYDNLSIISSYETP